MGVLYLRMQLALLLVQMTIIYGFIIAALWKDSDAQLIGASNDFVRRQWRREIWQRNCGENHLRD